MAYILAYLVTSLESVDVSLETAETPREWTIAPEQTQPRPTSPLTISLGIVYLPVLSSQFGQSHKN